MTVQIIKMKEKEGLKFSIKLEMEEAKDKNGKVIYQGEGKDRESTYSRHDPIALLNIVGTYESKRGTFKKYKISLTLRDKIEKAWRDDAKTLELSLDEGNFLKDLCEDFFDEKKKPEERMNVPLFWGKTIVSVLEQLA